MPPRRSQEQTASREETANNSQQRYAETYHRAFASGYKVASAMWASFCEDILDSWTGHSPGTTKIATEWRDRLDANRERTSELAARILRRGETKEMARGYRRVNNVCLNHVIPTAVTLKAKEYFRDTLSCDPRGRIDGRTSNGYIGRRVRLAGILLSWR